MGGTVSNASSNAANNQAAQQENQAMLIQETLQQKLNQMLFSLAQHLGKSVTDKDKQVTGGRRAMLVSQIRLSSSNDVSQELMDGLQSFFNAAQGLVEGDKDAAINNAVDGAFSILKGGLDAMFGVTSGQSMEKNSFVVLIINSVPVRIDYKLYSYSISVSQWGVEQNTSGMCYVAELAIIPWSELTDDEISFLVTQSLPPNFKDLDSLAKARAAQWLSLLIARQIANPDLNPDLLEEYLKEYQVAQDQFKEAIITGNLRQEVKAASKQRENQAVADKQKENQEKKQQKLNAGAGADSKIVYSS